MSKNAARAGRWTWQTWKPMVLSLVLVVSAIGFLMLTLLTHDVRTTTILGTAGVTSLLCFNLFRLFALLPGIIGVANHIVMSRQYATEAGEGGADGKSVTDPESEHRPTFWEALAASILLTVIFLIVAKTANADDQNLVGLVYAGYGAYISTLWFMLVRLNATALSPRFLINSALKTSIAMLIGFMASRSDIFKPAGPAGYFLIGLFLAFVMKRLKKSAMATFGVTQIGAADLPVRLLEGVDDGAVDVLEELGITSIQHLATMHAPEVCGRSQYPRHRVFDWIDQSILAVHSNGRINDLRAIGIHSAYALITIADHAGEASQCEATGPLHRAADDLFKEAERRLGLSSGGLHLVAACIRSDPAYCSLEQARHRCTSSRVDATPGKPSTIIHASPAN